MSEQLIFEDLPAPPAQDRQLRRPETQLVFSRLITDLVNNTKERIKADHHLEEIARDMALLIFNSRGSSHEDCSFFFKNIVETVRMIGNFLLRCCCSFAVDFLPLLI